MSEEFEIKQEMELQRAIKQFNENSIGYYDSTPRTTLDGEWEYEELLGVLNDDADKIIKEYNEKNKYRLVKDLDMQYPEYVVNKITEEYDLIELYNTEYDKHIHDEEKIFAIHHFEDRIKTIITKLLKDNMCS